MGRHSTFNLAVGKHRPSFAHLIRGAANEGELPYDETIADASPSPSSMMCFGGAAATAQSTALRLVIAKALRDRDEAQKKAEAEILAAEKAAEEAALVLRRRAEKQAAEEQRQREEEEEKERVRKEKERQEQEEETLRNALKAEEEEAARRAIQQAQEEERKKKVEEEEQESARLLLAAKKQLEEETLRETTNELVGREDETPAPVTTTTVPLSADVSTSLDATRVEAHTPVFANNRQATPAAVAEGAEDRSAQRDADEAIIDEDADVDICEDDADDRVADEDDDRSEELAVEEEEEEDEGPEEEEATYNPEDEETSDPEAYLHRRFARGALLNNGKYKLIRRLGEGQSSRVWLAIVLFTDHHDDENGLMRAGDRVAIKVCKRGSLYSDAVAYERRTIEYLSREEDDDDDDEEVEVKREGAETLSKEERSRRSGGCIAPLLDAFHEVTNYPLLNEYSEPLDEDDPDYEDPIACYHPCLVFNCLGAPLDKIMNLTNFNGINPRAVREIMRNVLKIAIRLSKKSIIHTDLKPENILLAHPGALLDEAVIKALQPTVKFLRSASASTAGGGGVDSQPPTPTLGATPSTTTPLLESSSLNENTNGGCELAEATPRFALVPPICSTSNNAAGGTSPSRHSAVSSRPSFSATGGGDGPLVPLLKDGKSALDVVLIDFGLSYFEPFEYRPPSSPHSPPSVRSRRDDDDEEEEYTEEQLALKEECNYQLGVEIQTREYRAPEIILGAFYNNRADLWSVACIAYELVTGRYLFDPKVAFEDNDDAQDADPEAESAEEKKLREDEEHLRLITFTIGDKTFPKDILSASDEDPSINSDGETIDIAVRGVFSSTFYDTTVVGRGAPLFDTAIRKLAPNSLIAPEASANGLRDLDAEVRPFLGPLEAPLFVSFLMKCLKWNPNDRPSAEELLAHPWLNRN